MNFEQLNLDPNLLKAVEEEGYHTPSPIQEKAIPPILAGRDVLGCAQTGTGKTAAFALPIIQNLSKTPRVKGTPRVIRCLILTPTRELATQIAQSFKDYGRYADLKCTTIFGGVTAHKQIQVLRNGIDILIATPGRLNDLINQGEVHLKNVETFVLDEADRMLDMGFIHDVKRIISYLPVKRQTLFFSATMPSEITKLISEILTDPVKIEVTPVSSTVEIIEQSVYLVDTPNKSQLLVHILQDKTITSALVFTRTKHGADHLVKHLLKNNIDAKAIHGNKSQNARQLALQSFKDGAIRVLVATDIAARGIDIDELSHVINYELPNIPESYVHRIGRTGRAGSTGIAISFCNIDEKEYLTDIQNLIGKKVPVVNTNPFPMTIFTPTPAKERGHRGSRPPRSGASENGGGAKRGNSDGKRTGGGNSDKRGASAGTGGKRPSGSVVGGRSFEEDNQNSKYKKKSTFKKDGHSYNKDSIRSLASKKRTDSIKSGASTGYTGATSKPYAGKPSSGKKSGTAQRSFQKKG